MPLTKYLGLIGKKNEDYVQDVVAYIYYIMLA